MDSVFAIAGKPDDAAGPGSMRTLSLYLGYRLMATFMRFKTHDSLVRGWLSCRYQIDWHE